MQISGTKTPIADVGEFGLIKGIGNLVRALNKGQRGVEVGIGDDGAIWKPLPGRELVITSDMLVEGVHFRHDWSKAESIGIRAMAVNLSDIAGMGARPRAAVISLGLRGDESDRWVYEFYRGALRLASKLHFAVVGGDLVRSPKATTVNVTVIGDLNPRKPALQRDAADLGDVIAVTGPLGLAAGGARILEEGNLSRDGAPRMMEAHRRPTPRVFQGLLLRWAGVRCGMDISDGLLGDLDHILQQSGYSAKLDFEKLPIPHAVRRNFDDWFDLALRGGEDFELLFTCPRETFDHVQRTFARFGCPPAIEIGTIEAWRDSGSPIQMIQTDRKTIDIEPGAHTHFSAP